MNLKDYARFTEINLAFAFSVYLISPVLAPYIKGMGFSSFQLGLMFSITPFILIFSAPVVGKFSDRVGRSG
jgi:MFS family permease